MQQPCLAIRVRKHTLNLLPFIGAKDSLLNFCIIIFYSKIENILVTIRFQHTRRIKKTSCKKDWEILLKITEGKSMPHAV